MKIIGSVHKFNTRRHYAANGQEIVWAVIERDDDRLTVYAPTRRCVAFSDRARGISGEIDLHFGNLDIVTDTWVLRAYDDFHYRSGWTAPVDFLVQAAK